MSADRTALCVFLAVAAILVGGAHPTALFAQGFDDGGWASQTIELEGGWNPVWISVDPVPSDPAVVLSGLDYKSIRMLVPPGEAGGERKWLTFFRNGPSYLNTFPVLEDESGTRVHKMSGQRGYVIEMNTPGTLTVRGRPRKPSNRMSGKVRTLVGADVDPAATPPSFEDYFSRSSVRDKVSKPFRLDPTTGEYEGLTMQQAMQAGVAYSMASTQNLIYRGPIRVDGRADGLQFSKSVYSQLLLGQVASSSSSQQLKIVALASQTPPQGFPGDAGDAGVGQAGPGGVAGATGGNATWLEYKDSNGDWQPLTDGATVSLAPGQTQWTLEVRAVRRGRTEATVELTGTGYQALVQIIDGHGNCVVVPAGMQVTSSAGLWIGEAQIGTVQNRAGQDGAVPVFPLELIVSLPKAGPAQLWPRACVRTTLDGRPLLRQLYAIQFHRKINLTGSVDATGISGTLTGTLSMPANHPLNPYRHLYHPEHGQGFAVTRTITLTFSDQYTHPNPNVNAGLGALRNQIGDNQLVGMYEETIGGLSQTPITVRGPFRLHRLRDDPAQVDCP